MQNDPDGPVLAVYDFRSKQEYIYRTNRMRQIAGASELIAGMYARFLKITLPGTDDEGICRSIRNDWRDREDRFPLQDEGEPLFFMEDEAGIVVYEGGGNLCILFSDINAYRAANREFSRIVIENGYSLRMVVGCAPWVETGNPRESFSKTLKDAYRALDKKKRVGRAGVPCNVLPITQVDAVTYQPIVRKAPYGKERREYTEEAVCKQAVYDDRASKDHDWAEHGKYIDDVGTQNEDDSLIAVVYFDGNSIGSRLADSVRDAEDMRDFSEEVHRVLVTQTEEAMKAAIEKMPDERQRDYRIIVDHGDEITLICNAHAAPVAIGAYFSSLEKDAREGRQRYPKYRPYHACAGMAICHAHDPFSEVYRIAEQCCESGKEANRQVIKCGGDEASYVDWHFCRAGILGSLKRIRKAQEGFITGRPYKIGESYDRFVKIGKIISKARDYEDISLKRTDLKELARAILKGDSWYALEYERMRAKDCASMNEAERVLYGADVPAERELVRRGMRNPLFDVASSIDVFDVLFKRA